MKKDKIIIVGAGLCGTLLGLRLAQRGYKVALYERQGDMRLEHVDAGRSINLALSSRGLKALEKVGIKEQILKECIPMKGRMIHPVEGESFLSPYSGRASDYINSVSRGGLNIALLNAADEFDDVTVFFNSKCESVDLENAKATFKNLKTGEVREEESAIIIGTDGAGSSVRRSMMNQTTQLLFNFSQNFLRHGYKELSIPPAKNGGWQIEKNALHIWPRGSFMIIALPNLDGSFTVTMFHPFEGENGFNNLNTKEKVKAFFEKEFPTLIPYMPHYMEEYFENPVGTLGTIKCYPWQAYGKALIMGDAAHAIVPFYGQGMNAAFEDVSVFDEILDQQEGDWLKIFNAFQDARVENSNAIADLAIDNFTEMQDKVDDQDFIKKRKLEMELEQKYEDYYSKYSMVTFQPDLPYSSAMKLGRKQDELLLKICGKTDPSPLNLDEVMQQILSLRS
ncbi:MAG: kynurenine 3-monooxygenase [Saprospiraceae bacterium]|jgi:kynurenine 3-monooxygenase